MNENSSHGTTTRIGMAPDASTKRKGADLSSSLVPSHDTGLKRRRVDETVLSLSSPTAVNGKNTDMQLPGEVTSHIDQPVEESDDDPFASPIPARSSKDVLPSAKFVLPNMDSVPSFDDIPWPKFRDYGVELRELDIQLSLDEFDVADDPTLHNSEAVNAAWRNGQNAGMNTQLKLTPPSSSPMGSTYGQSSQTHRNSNLPSPELQFSDSKAQETDRQHSQTSHVSSLQVSPLSPCHNERGWKHKPQAEIAETPQQLPHPRNLKPTLSIEQQPESSSFIPSSVASSSSSSSETAGPTTVSNCRTASVSVFSQIANPTTHPFQGDDDSWRGRSSDDGRESSSDQAYTRSAALWSHTIYILSDSDSDSDSNSSDSSSDEIIRQAEQPAKKSAAGRSPAQPASVPTSSATHTVAGKSKPTSEVTKSSSHVTAKKTDLGNRGRGPKPAQAQLSGSQERPAVKAKLSPLNFICKVAGCSQKFAQKDQLVAHESNHGLLRCPCSSCPHHGMDYEDLVQHLNQAHDFRQPGQHKKPQEIPPSVFYNILPDKESECGKYGAKLQDSEPPPATNTTPSDTMPIVALQSGQVKSTTTRQHVSSMPRSEKVPISEVKSASKASDKTSSTPTNKPTQMIPPSTSTVKINDCGSLHLHVGLGSKMRDFLVSADQLAHASPVCKSMLFDYSQSQPQSNAVYQVLSLPDDDPKILKIVLDMAHGNYGAVPKTLVLDDLVNVCRTLAKYNCTKVCAAWARIWVSPLLCEQKESDKAVRLQQAHEECGKKLYVAWELGSKELFEQTVANLLNTSEIDRNGNCSVQDVVKSKLPIPPKIIDAIESARETIISRLLGIFTNRLSYHQQAKRCCTQINSKDTGVCVDSITGGIFRGLQSMEIEPFGPSKVHQSIGWLSNALLHIRISSVHPLCNPRDNMRRDVLKLINDQKTWSPISEFYYEHLREQAKKSGLVGS